MTSAIATAEKPLHGVWPLFRLRLHTRRLELRPVDDELIPPLAAVARRGVHPVGASPFANGWTERPAHDWESGLGRYFWAQRGSWSIDAWALPFAVLLDGRPIGVQQVTADRFPVRRAVGTGSWLSSGRQRQGIGTEMREAVLHFAFELLGADVAVSGAFPDATGSIRVSEKLGYLRNGTRRDETKGGIVDSILFRLPRREWHARPRTAVRVEGFAGCEPLFGISEPAHQPTDRSIT